MNAPLTQRSRESWAKLSLWLNNRRRVAAETEAFQKHFELRTAGLLAANAVTFLSEQVLHLGERHPSFRVLFVVSEWSVWFIDVITVILVFSILAVRRFYFKDETRFWVYGFNPEELHDLAGWLQGLPSRAAELEPKVAWGCEDLEPTISHLNFNAYKLSAFRTEHASIVRRNAALIRKNQHIFLVYYDMGFKSKVIGYSSLLPLDEDGTEDYLHGNMGDDSLMLSKAICSYGERPCSIILFAVVLSTDVPLARGGENGSYSAHLNRSLQIHFEGLCPDAFKERSLPPVYVQTDKPELRKVYETLGFKASGYHSKEGFEFLKLEEPFRNIERSLASRTP